MRSPRSQQDLSPHQTVVLLEGNEQTSTNTLQMPPCVKGKRQNANVPTADNGYSRPTLQITTDLITDLNVSTSGNQHILTFIHHLMGWPDIFPFPTKRCTLLPTFSLTIISPSTCVPDSYCPIMECNSTAN